MKCDVCNREIVGGCYFDSVGNVGISQTLNLCEFCHNEYEKSRRRHPKVSKVTNVERMMKFCTSVGDIVGYPYFFNWSPPTNHRDNSLDGSFEDVDYVIFRVGRYVKREANSGISSPMETQIVFAQTSKIVADFLPFNSLLNDGKRFSDWTFPIKSMEDLKSNVVEIRKKIDTLFCVNENGGSSFMDLTGQNTYDISGKIFCDVICGDKNNVQDSVQHE